MIAYEKFSKVESEFSVQNTTKFLFAKEPLQNYLRISQKRVLFLQGAHTTFATLKIQIIQQNLERHYYEMQVVLYFKKNRFVLRLNSANIIAWYKLASESYE